MGTWALSLCRASLDVARTRELSAWEAQLLEDDKLAGPSRSHQIAQTTKKPHLFNLKQVSHSTTSFIPHTTMAARILSPAIRAISSSAALRTTRSFQTSSQRLADAAAALPARKPVGAFRGG